MRISVVVVSYNVRAPLRRCLAALAGAYQVVVVDNASRDDSVAMVRRDFPGVQLIAQAHNGGFSQAVNRGAAVSDGDALLLLNPDAELAPGGLAALGAALQARPDAWALGARQLDADGNLQLTWGRRPSLVGELWRRTLQRRLDRGQHGVGRWLDWRMRRAQRVPWVAGSCLLVRRQAFARVGGFDERYFLYFEDIDFCLRLGRAGGAVYYDPSVSLLHHRGRSARTDRALAERAYRRSQLDFWAWHRGPWLRGLVATALRLRGRHPDAAAPGR